MAQTEQMCIRDRVGHEGESWKRLLEEAFPKLLAGSFDAKYQKELNQAFERNLGVHADSE